MERVEGAKIKSDGTLALSCSSSSVTGSDHSEGCSLARAYGNMVDTIVSRICTASLLDLQVFPLRICTNCTECPCPFKGTHEKSTKREEEEGTRMIYY